MASLTRSFQSSPDLNAGCNYEDQETVMKRLCMFQSSPDPQVKCNLRLAGACAGPRKRFSPHPTMKPSATHPEPANGGVRSRISILT